MSEEKETERETRLVMVESASANPEDAIDLIDLIRLLLGAWKLIATVTILVTGGAVAYALLAPKVYRAETLLALASEETGGITTTWSQLGGLAAMAGVSVPADSDKEQVIATLSSRKFAGRFIAEKNLLPILFEDQWDASQDEWKSGSEEEPPSPEAAYRAFSGVMSVSDDKKTGLVTLSILWKDPEVAAEWANDLVRRLNVELQGEAIEGSRKRIGYLEQELANTKEKGMHEVLYTLLEVEEQKAMLANVNDEFALKVLDPAVPPELRESPKRKRIVVLGGVCGLFLGIFAVFLREFVKKLKTQDPGSLSPETTV